MKDVGGQIAKQTLANRVIALIESARRQTVAAVNVAMVYTYYEIGRQIVEEEQGGKTRAGYGERLIRDLSSRLTGRFGKGWSVENLTLMRKFFLVYSADGVRRRTCLARKPEIVNGVYEISGCRKNGIAPFTLSWSHYLKLMRIEDPNERSFYEIESRANNWSLRDLQRQFDSSLYERLALSRDKKKVLDLAKRGHVVEKPSDAVKEPYVLEFLGLKEETAYTRTSWSRGSSTIYRSLCLNWARASALSDARSESRTTNTTTGSTLCSTTVYSGASCLSI